MPSDNLKFLLHTYFRSSCSARLRTACRLKDIETEYAFVHLLKDEQNSATHRSLNPSMSVPVLTELDKPDSFPITQSVAALEYLEEIMPDRRPLLPPLSDPLARAKVRVLVNIIACDVQPVTNRRVILDIGGLGGDAQAWCKRYMTRGLEAYEEVAKKTAGKYSVGDEITLADVCLVPAVWGGQRFGVDVDALPTIKRIYEAMSKEEAVIGAHWRNQPDTPDDLRDKPASALPA